MLSFIILHYKNIDDTIECLKNIKKLDNQEKISIIVVDNNTLDKNNQKIIEKYTKDIIKLEENIGFAKANNIGIKYAKEKYNSDYYFVINNDVFIYQKDIVKKINESYKKYKFDMMGPKIDSPSKESINPFPIIKDIDQEIKKCKILIKIYKNSILSALLEIYMKIKYTFKKKVVLENGKKYQENVPLHGCGIIFSKEYIKKYEYPFFNETFLFHEEEFLFNRVNKDKLKSIYNPEITIFHKEGSSIKKDNKSKRLSKLFREKERLKSLELLKTVGGQNGESNN